MVLVLSLSAAATARAALYTLNSGSTVSVQTESLSSSNAVTALPYTTPSAVNSSATQARIAPQLTSDTLVLQLTAITSGGQASGQMDIRFHAAADATFSGYTALTSTGGITAAELDFVITDLTTNTAAASFTRSATTPGTLSITSGIQGSLIAGHDYAFDPVLFFRSSGAGSGSGSASLTIVPEPAAVALAGLGAAGLIRRRRR